MTKDKIIELLNNRLINKSELVKRINMKGLSISSLFNKLNPNHKQKIKDGEIEAIKSELKKFSNDINEGLK
jgi:hypothetical protein